MVEPGRIRIPLAQYLFLLPLLALFFLTPASTALGVDRHPAPVMAGGEAPLQAFTAIEPYGLDNDLIIRATGAGDAFNDVTVKFEYYSNTETGEDVVITYDDTTDPDAPGEQTELHVLPEGGLGQTLTG